MRSTSASVAARSGPISAWAAWHAAARSAYALVASARALAGVDHHHLEVVGDRHGSTVSEVQSIRRAWPSTPTRRRQLVHDPARHARRSLLGPLAEPRQLDAGALEAEGQRDRDLERGRRRQPRADRERGLDLPGEARRSGRSSATTPAT